MWDQLLCVLWLAGKLIAEFDRRLEANGVCKTEIRSAKSRKVTKELDFIWKLCYRLLDVVVVCYFFGFSLLVALKPELEVDLPNPPVEPPKPPNPPPLDAPPPKPPPVDVISTPAAALCELPAAVVGVLVVWVDAPKPPVLPGLDAAQRSNTTQQQHVNMWLSNNAHTAQSNGTSSKAESALASCSKAASARAGSEAASRLAEPSRAESTTRPEASGCRSKAFAAESALLLSSLLLLLLLLQLWWQLKDGRFVHLVFLSPGLLSLRQVSRCERVFPEALLVPKASFL